MVDLNIYRSRIGLFNNIYKCVNSISKGESSYSHNKKGESYSYITYEGKSSKFGRKFIFSNLFILTASMLLLNAQIQYDFLHIKSIVNNKVCHISNGNTLNCHSFKMAHINKGNSNFLNKYDDIARMLDFFKPHLLSIQEANYSIETNVRFRGYNLEYNQLTKTYKTARTVLLIREDISYERCSNFEDEYISSIWVQIFMSKNKSFYVMSAYRQWGF